MSQPVSPEAKARWQKLILYAIDLKRGHASDISILTDLEKIGATSEEARKILTVVHSMEQRPTSWSSSHEDALKNDALRNMGIGALICIVGLVITFGTMSSRGGSYVIAYGAIIGGALQFLRGAYQYNNS